MITESAPKPGDTPRTSVMVVEPDVLIRTAIADYLRECGYVVIETQSAEEAIRVVESGQAVQVVFAEVNLPQMSGFELARQLRARVPAIGVLLTHGAEGAAEKAGELCDEGPLPKPYHHAEVLRRIRLLQEKG